MPIRRITRKNSFSSAYPVFQVSASGCDLPSRGEGGTSEVQPVWELGPNVGMDDRGAQGWSQVNLGKRKGRHEGGQAETSHSIKLMGRKSGACQFQSSSRAKGLREKGKRVGPKLRGGVPYETLLLPNLKEKVKKPEKDDPKGHEERQARQ